MPTYQGQISEEGVIALVEYIKNLDSNYRVEQTSEHDRPAAGGRGKNAPAASRAVEQPAGQNAAPKGTVKQ